jgi:hypothetical protein
MRQPDLDRVHSITDNFFFWQGLRLVPVGAALLVLSATYASWWPIDRRFQGVVLVTVLLVGIVLSGAIGSYYARTFGRVAAAPGAHARRSTIKWLVAYPAMAASLLIDGAVRPPIFITGIVWAAATLAYWWSTGRGRPHYLGATLLFASTAAWPALGAAARGRAMINLFLAVVGATYMINGVLDHLELRRTLPPLLTSDD